MKHRLVLLATTFGLALFISGCGTSAIMKRIQENPAVFTSLTPAQQEQIQHGGIEPGYTQDMVYLALGRPTKVMTSANGRDTVWIYKNYYAPNATPQASLRMNVIDPSTSGSLRGKASRTYGNVFSGVTADPDSASLSSTKALNAEPSYEIPDIPSETFYVTFRRNKVIDMRLDA